jgi:hypothetical protein
MAAPAIQLNPNITTQATGTFGVSWDGLTQGTAYPDPSTRFNLSAGVLSNSETLPMWGGVGIYEDVPPAVSSVGLSGTLNTPVALGGAVGRAAGLTTLTGFSVFDQAYGMINTPQSPVPTIGSYGQVMFYRLGSGARMVVAMAPSLVNLEGGLVTAQVSWDYTNQELVPYTAAYVANPITGAVWASTSGGQTTFTVTNDLSAVLSAGKVIDVSGVVSTGGTGVGYNGNFVVVSVGATTIVVTQVLASSPGTYSSGGSVAAGGGALPCKVLRTYASGCMTVQYNAATGFASWNYNGSAAVIQLGPMN